MSKNIILGEIQNSKQYIFEINRILKKELISKKYKVVVKIVDEEDWEDRIAAIHAGKYDYIVDSFFIQTDRMKKVNFTYSFATIIPRIIYDPDTTKTNTIKYFNYLLKIWVKPFIYLFLLAIIVGVKHKVT
jgi:ABC-type amino acid transport substrate-binding protein